MDWLSNLFGGGNSQPAQEGWRYNIPPMSPEHKQLYDSLYGIAQNGFPEIAQQGQDMYQNDLMPYTREQYETKRNPYGGSFSDTPEFTQLAQGARGVASDVATQNMNARLSAYRNLMNLVRYPDTEYTQPQPSAGQNAMSFFQPIASSFMNNKFGSANWMDIFKNMFGNNQGDVAQDNYSDFYSNPYGENYGSSFSEGLTDQFGSGGYDYASQLG